MATTYTIKPYSFFKKIKIVLKRDVVKEASKNLIGLSNSIFRNSSIDNNLKRRDEIIKLLRIKSTI